MLVQSYELNMFPRVVPTTLTAYVPDVYDEIDPARKRPGIILCPGGAYRFRSRTEAEPVALAYVSGGCNVFLLEYAVAPARYPVALRQLAAAVAFVRTHADALHTDPDKLLLCGFSAGGHLCANLGVAWQRDDLFPADLRAELRRPNGMILCYPVITFHGKTHRGSQENLLGESCDNEEALREVCLDELVTEHTPPAFLWHHCTDASVPALHSMKFATALMNCGISTELHIFPKGPHGTSLGTNQALSNPDTIRQAEDSRIWMDLALRWIRKEAYRN